MVWNIFPYFPYIGNNNPNWLIFFRGVETTNQICVYIILPICSIWVCPKHGGLNQCKTRAWSIGISRIHGMHGPQTSYSNLAIFIGQLDFRSPGMKGLNTWTLISKPPMNVRELIGKHQWRTASFWGIFQYFPSWSGENMRKPPGAFADAWVLRLITLASTCFSPPRRWQAWPWEVWIPKSIEVLGDFSSIVWLAEGRRLEIGGDWRRVGMGGDGFSQWSVLSSFLIFSLMINPLKTTAWWRHHPSH